MEYTPETERGSVYRIPRSGVLPAVMSSSPTVNPRVIECGAALELPSSVYGRLRHRCSTWGGAGGVVVECTREPERMGYREEHGIYLFDSEGLGEKAGIRSAHWY